MSAELQNKLLKIIGEAAKQLIKIHDGELSYGDHNYLVSAFAERLWAESEPTTAPDGIG